MYVEREDEKGRKKFTIVRDLIRPPSIDPDRARVLLSEVKGPNGKKVTKKVGYFYISSFGYNTDRDLKDTLNRFDKEGVDGVIMDLRGNPGGLYDQAKEVADAFIKSGTLVSMVGVGGVRQGAAPASKGGSLTSPWRFWLMTTQPALLKLWRVP